jgi:hypothetical protein
VSIVNRRNAVLGWSVWKVGKHIVIVGTKSVAKDKAKKAAPSVEGGRPNKPLIAMSVAGIAGGVLAAARRKRRGSEAPSS